MTVVTEATQASVQPRSWQRIWAVVLFVGAIGCYVLAAFLPWMRATREHAAPYDVSAWNATGDSSVFLLYLIVAPLLLALAAAARLTSRWRPALRDAGVVAALALCIAMCTLLRHDGTATLGSYNADRTTMLPGIYVALLGIVCAAASLAVDTLPRQPRSWAPGLLLILAVVAFGIAAWQQPWVHIDVASAETVPDLNVATTLFGFAYLLVSLIQLSLVGVVVGSGGRRSGPGLRSGVVVLGGGWTFVHVLALVHPRYFVFGYTSGSVHARPAAYVALAALMLAGIAAVITPTHGAPTAVARVPQRRLGQATWAVAAAFAMASLVVPWVSYADVYTLTDVNTFNPLVGLFDTDEAGGSIRVLIVVAILLLLTMAWIAVVSRPDQRKVRLATLGFGVGLLIVELAVRHAPQRLVDRGYAHDPRVVERGLYFMIIATVLASVAPWFTTLSYRRRVEDRQVGRWLERAALVLLVAGFAVTFVESWAHQYVVGSDSANFDGDIFPSQISVAVLLVGLLLLSGSFAIVGGRGNQAPLRLATLVLALATAPLWLVVWVRPGALGFDPVILLDMRGAPLSTHRLVGAWAAATFFALAVVTVTVGRAVRRPAVKEDYRPVVRSMRRSMER